MSVVHTDRSRRRALDQSGPLHFGSPTGRTYSNFERTETRSHSQCGLKEAFVLKTNTFKCHQVKSSHFSPTWSLF